MIFVFLSVEFLYNVFYDNKYYHYQDIAAKQCIVAPMLDRVFAHLSCGAPCRCVGHPLYHAVNRATKHRGNEMTRNHELSKNRAHEMSRNWAYDMTKNDTSMINANGISKNRGHEMSRNVAYDRFIAKNNLIRNVPLKNCRHSKHARQKLTRSIVLNDENHEKQSIERRVKDVNFQSSLRDYEAYKSPVSVAGKDCHDGDRIVQRKHNFDRDIYQDRDVYHQVLRISNPSEDNLGDIFHSTNQMNYDEGDNNSMDSNHMNQYHNSNEYNALQINEEFLSQTDNCRDALPSPARNVRNSEPQKPDESVESKYSESALNNAEVSKRIIKNIPSYNTETKSPCIRTSCYQSQNFTPRATVYKSPLFRTSNVCLKYNPQISNPGEVSVGFEQSDSGTKSLENDGATSVDESRQSLVVDIPVSGHHGCTPSTSCHHGCIPSTSCHHDCIPSTVAAGRLDAARCTNSHQLVQKCAEKAVCSCGGLVSY